VVTFEPAVVGEAEQLARSVTNSGGFFGAVLSERPRHATSPPSAQSEQPTEGSTFLLEPYVRGGRGQRRGGLTVQVGRRLSMTQDRARAG
jgi:hypothetical protein